MEHTYLQCCLVQKMLENFHYMAHILPPPKGFHLHRAPLEMTHLIHARILKIATSVINAVF